MKAIATLAELEALYGVPGETSLVKESPVLTPTYRRLIEASPFCILATRGPDGLDASPRGDDGPVVRILDDKTVLLPDRRGNNRIDSLRNIIADPQVALLFLIPGSGTTLRLNGRAVLTSDADLRATFAMAGQMPRSVIVLTAETVFFQCARAVVRSRLWDPETRIDPAILPTPGQILSDQSAGRVGGQPYDDEWPERARKSLW
ncbi:MAG: pyridoxamine 5'-phosphate oxidase family protein [Rhodospirillales bacterium]